MRITSHLAVSPYQNLISKASTKASKCWRRTQRTPRVQRGCAGRSPGVRVPGEERVPQSSASPENPRIWGEGEPPSFQPGWPQPDPIMWT